ncbi:Uncharacterized protein TCM_039331 [Theobroma cacao]|uniref:Uncharacterized protein n=1 Tax=Theobroma cacao TaxID=3641 RepID=A0A061GR15_THECC|nr:Uncharacterized protein TCM_039331 [Theobroma cacao]
MLFSITFHLPSLTLRYPSWFMTGYQILIFVTEYRSFVTTNGSFRLLTSSIKDYETKKMRRDCHILLLENKNQY